MMQGMMAAMQQRQGYPAMQNMPGMHAMPGMQGMPTAAPAQVAATASSASGVLPSPEQASLMEKTEAIQKCVDNLSVVEKEYYTFLWTTSRGDAETLAGKAAFDFLMKSQLTKEQCKRIWDLADWQKQHFLCWQDFVVAMKLIAACQKKQLVSLERVFISGGAASKDCPEFEGVANVASYKGGTLSPSGTGGGAAATEVADARLPDMSVAPAHVTAPAPS